MYLEKAKVHPVYMAKDKRPPSRGQMVVTRFKAPDRPPHFLRAWRKHRDMTLEVVAERVGETTGEGFTHASLSRIERGKQPYSQPILEALADIYQTDPASLLMRDPAAPDAIWSIWDRAKPGQQKIIVELANTVLKTGT